MVIGVAIAILGSATPFSKDPRTDIPIILAIRVAAGLFIALLGFMALTHKSFSIGFIKNFLNKRELSKSMFGYGILYNAAAIGCTGPIMLGLMLYAYSTGSFILALTSFATFSLTMGILMVIFTVRKTASTIGFTDGFVKLLRSVQGPGLFYGKHFPLFPYYSQKVFFRCRHKQIMLC